MPRFNFRKMFFAILIGLALLSVSQVQSASLKSVQSGTATFDSLQNTHPLTLSAVDTSKTIVWGGISWGGAFGCPAKADSETTLGLPACRGGSREQGSRQRRRPARNRN